MPERENPREEKTILTLSVLITREDYMQYAAQLRREQRRGHLPLITGGGALLGALGLAGLFFGSWISLAPSVAAGLLLVGIFLIGYDGIFAPLLDKMCIRDSFRPASPGNRNAGRTAAYPV